MTNIMYVLYYAISATTYYKMQFLLHIYVRVCVHLNFSKGFHCISLYFCISAFLYFCISIFLYAHSAFPTSAWPYLVHSPSTPCPSRLETEEKAEAARPPRVEDENPVYGSITTLLTEDSLITDQGRSEVSFDNDCYGSWGSCRKIVPVLKEELK